MGTPTAVDMNAPTARRAEAATQGRWTTVRHSRLVKAFSYKVLSIIGLLVLWWLLSLTLPAHVLPGPLQTGRTLLEEVGSGRVSLHVYTTLVRVALSFLLAMAMGIVVGTIMGLFRRAEAVLDIWIMVGLTVPGLVYIILAFMWFGLNEFSTIVGIAITTFPSIAINVWEGVKNIDNRLVDMARVFHASKTRRLTRVIIPQILPFVMASARFGLGVAWKITVLAELLGRSDGVGYMLHYWFQLYSMSAVFAWTVLFTILMLVIELVILKRIEMRLFKWRPAARI